MSRNIKKFETISERTSIYNSQPQDILSYTEDDGNGNGVTNIRAQNRIIYELDSPKITFGSDFMVYDKEQERFGVLLGRTANFDTFDFDRYETNFDIPIQICENNVGKYLHAVAIDEAISAEKYPGIQRYSVIDSTYSAAEYSFYRIDVDNSKTGGYHYKITNSNATVEGDVSWAAGATVESIKNQMTTGTYIGYAVTTNNPVALSVRSTTGEAVGVHTGGYGNNVVTLSNIIDGSALLTDMSKYAVISETLRSGDDYDSSLTVMNDSFKNWRGVSARTILGSTAVPAAAISSAYSNTGQNYSYRNGINFAGWKAWATASGVAECVTDGVNGTANNSTGKIMRKAYFDRMMDTTDANYSAAMHEYYYNLLYSLEQPYIYLRNEYRRRYSYVPQTLYDVYLMSHMLDVGNSSGCVNSFRNLGKVVTESKGTVFTVTYNWKYSPAYIPEYNALRYGDGNNVVFRPGFYYHPEPVDLGVFLRDSVMARCNEAWSKVPVSLHGNRTSLGNSTSLGCVGEYSAYKRWYFSGNYRCITHTYRYSSNFRCRPCSAYPIIP